jgi:hypothetical protein
VKKYFYRLSSLIAVLSLLGMAMPVSSAAEQKPVVTVSFAGYSELKADVEAIGKLSGRPELAQLMEAMLAMVTQGKGLAGLDKDRAIGAVLLNDGSEEFTGYAFMPIADLAPYVELMKAAMGDSVKAVDGVYEIPIRSETMYLTQKGKWTYIAQKKETLASVSNDPASMLGDLPKRYLLAVRASVKNVPDALKQQYMGLVQMMTQGTQQPDAMKANIEQIQTMSKELDEVLLGLALDRKTNSTYLDMEMTAKPGTSLAAQLAVKSGKTDFAGMKIPGAAITFNTASTITDADVARVKKTLESLHDSLQDNLKEQDLPKEQMDVATDVLNQLIDLAVKTVELKKTDCGAALIMEPKAMTMVAGSIVADGSKIEGILKKLVAEAQKTEPEAAKMVKLNSETYKGIRFHTIAVPCPDPQLSELVGKNVDVVLGVGDKKVFVAAGRDAAKVLKAAIDDSASDAGKEIPATQIVLSASKIARFISAVADDNQAKAVADRIAGVLDQSGGKDHVTVTTQPITNGARVRLELQEGIIKALSETSSGMLNIR